MRGKFDSAVKISWIQAPPHRQLQRGGRLYQWPLDLPTAVSSLRSGRSSPIGIKC